MQIRENLYCPSSLPALHPTILSPTLSPQCCPSRGQGGSTSAQKAFPLSPQSPVVTVISAGNESISPHLRSLLAWLTPPHDTMSTPRTYTVQGRNPGHLRKQAERLQQPGSAAGHGEPFQRNHPPLPLLDLHFASPCLLLVALLRGSPGVTVLRAKEVSGCKPRAAWKDAFYKKTPPTLSTFPPPQKTVSKPNPRALW